MYACRTLSLYIYIYMCVSMYNIIYIREWIYYIHSVLWRAQRETLFHHFPGKSAVSTFYTIHTHTHTCIHVYMIRECGVLQTTTGPLKNEHRPKPINQTTTRVRDPQTIRLHPPTPSTAATRNRLNTMRSFIPDIPYLRIYP